MIAAADNDFGPITVPDEFKPFTNGCSLPGASWSKSKWPVIKHIGRFIRWLGNGWWEEECNSHDYEYHVGKTEEDRLRADRRLKAGIIRCSGKKGIKSRFGGFVARNYFRAVRKFGKKYFNGNDLEWHLGDEKSVELTTKFNEENPHGSRS